MSKRKGPSLAPQNISSDVWYYENERNIEVIISVPLEAPCVNCNGSGWGPYDPWDRRNPCLQCQGTGRKMTSSATPKGEE